MFFLDDMVLIDENREGVNFKLEICGNYLESKSFKLSSVKTKYQNVILIKR